MNRKAVIGWVSWVTCFGVLSALAVGLDPYRRPPLRYGYGLDRHEYFRATRTKAEELQEAGSYRIGSNENWLLRGGWADGPAARRSGQALAEQRRVRLVLPVLTPGPVQVRLRVEHLPAEGRAEAPLEVEYGVNGIALGRSLVPPQGTVLKFRVESSTLHRGDNIIFLYRVTRRGDATPWLSLSWMSARVLQDGA